VIVLSSRAPIKLLLLAPRGNCGSGKRGKIQLDIFSVFIWSGFMDKTLSNNLG
jgi:hypothetical protein